MPELFAIGISVIVVWSLVIVLGKRFRISPRYERKPRIDNPWSALDQGIDPSDEKTQ